MHYQLSLKGVQYKPGELPRSAERFLNVFEPNSPADTAQVAKALHKPKAHVEDLLNYLTTQGFLVRVEAPPKPKATVKPKGLGPHFQSIEQLAEQEFKKQKTRQKWAHSPKGKLSHTKYEQSPNGKTSKHKYQQGPKGKAAYERWRCRIKLTPKGLAKLQDPRWTKLHHLLAFVADEKPSKAQLEEKDFDMLRTEGYI